LGKLVLVNRKARIGAQSATGEQINIPAKRVVKFRVAKAAKDAILGAKYRAYFLKGTLRCQSAFFVPTSQP